MLKTGPGHEEVDPLIGLEAELSQYRVASVPGLNLPPLSGGAIGYVGYDCVRYFEPKTQRELVDVLQLPESLFMLFDTVIAVDHFYQTVKVVTYLSVGDHGGTGGDTGVDLAEAYNVTCQTLTTLVHVIQQEAVPLPVQAPIEAHTGNPQAEFTSSVEQTEYEHRVRLLQRHIQQGDIIQAVPSRRLARPTQLHPFNVYRELRTLNPSPYMFFLDCDGFQIVGASPELLVKAERGSEPDAVRIVTHPIAGTAPRGATPAEDVRLGQELAASTKDRAEHVMLVDLARNDVNRVCRAEATRVERLMAVERFSHVQHLVSAVAGELRPGYTRFDAFRAVFPAGTVSGAPKVRAMQLIGELERERRGVYGGAVGYFGFDSRDMDTCIALRTTVMQHGVAYLQAGGGVVFDSDPADEWQETVNKLRANMQAVVQAEQRYRGS